MAQKPIVLDSAACIYNPHFTQAVINSTGPKATPRLNERSQPHTCASSGTYTSHITTHGTGLHVTQNFDRNCKDIEADSELAVKESLIVDYKPIDGVSKAEFELLYGRYDFKMVTFGKKHSVAGATEVCSVV
ncbi:hypothetical protein PMIN05_007431 [Paraphaeosphaeria minitans]